MSMLDGVSQCWWLSTTCSVDWDAWSAVGTLSAVVVALFGPSIQRRFVRRKANALFALAYRSSMVGAKGRLENLGTRFPLDPTEDAAWAVHSMLTQSGATQTNFMEICNRLDELTSREVDLTKWGAVDLDLAAKISVAIESAAHFQLGADTLAQYSDGRDWYRMMASVHAAQQRALHDVAAATDAIHEALNGYATTANQD